MSRELQGRYAILGLSHQIHAQKPGGKGQFTGFQDGATGERCLVAAAVALVELSGFQGAILPATTQRAFKTIRPAPFEKLISALLFLSVLLKELHKAHAFLKLDFVLGHDTSPNSRKTSVVSLDEKIA